MGTQPRQKTYWMELRMRDARSTNNWSASGILRTVTATREDSDVRGDGERDNCLVSN